MHGERLWRYPAGSLRGEAPERVALNCWVIRPGTIAAGDPVELVDHDALPAHVGGWIAGAPC